MTIYGNHREKISFVISDSPHSPIILGLPWLGLNNQQVDWRVDSQLECGLPCVVPKVGGVFRAHAPDASRASSRPRQRANRISRISAGI